MGAILDVQFNSYIDFSTISAPQDRIVKFIYSEKATNFAKSSPYF